MCIRHIPNINTHEILSDSKTKSLPCEFSDSISTDFLSHEALQRKTSNGFGFSDLDNLYESDIRILIRVEVKSLPCEFLDSISTDFLTHEALERKTSNGFGIYDHDNL